jgi:hypothetical protein
MPNFKVAVCRVGYSHKILEIEAENEKMANNIALDSAGGYEFTENDYDYKIIGTIEEAEKN